MGAIWISLIGLLVPNVYKAKKCWKHFRPKNFSTNTKNPSSEIQIAPFSA